jgi:hypothetical protein
MAGFPTTAAHGTPDKRYVLASAVLATNFARFLFGLLLCQ